MNGALLFGLAIAWLIVDILIATAMGRIKDQRKFLKVRTAFVLVNIVVILSALMYLYLHYGSDNI